METYQCPQQLHHSSDLSVKYLASLLVSCLFQQYHNHRLAVMLAFLKYLSLSWGFFPTSPLDTEILYTLLQIKLPQKSFWFLWLARPSENYDVKIRKLGRPSRWRMSKMWRSPSSPQIHQKYIWASLVVQWLRICLPMQGTQVRALVWEDPTCRGATRPVSHNYWACTSGACAPQQERLR